MKKLLTTAFAAVMAVTGVSAGAVTASAAPVVPLVQASPNTDFIQVQGDGRFSRRDEWNQRFIPRRNFNNRNWDGGPRYGSRSGFYVREGRGFYNGHRGYREYRRGYRRHGDWWFPAGAFVAGAIIGGALSAPGPTYYDPPVRRVYRGSLSQSHVQWCYDRYRSYRASDNTFQPYNGPRQQCWSPYS